MHFIFEMAHEYVCNDERNRGTLLRLIYGQRNLSGSGSKLKSNSDQSGDEQVLERIFGASLMLFKVAGMVSKHSTSNIKFI